jgi:hypothetical protein
MKHERLDARRRPAVREHDDRPIDDGSASGGSPHGGSTDDGSAHDRSEALPDDPDRVRRRIRDRAERIERREVAEAISSLEARGDLTEEQRETVRLLGTAIARRLTADPESTLDRTGRDEPGTVRAVARLFDVESE